MTLEKIRAKIDAWRLRDKFQNYIVTRNDEPYARITFKGSDNELEVIAKVVPLDTASTACVWFHRRVRGCGFDRHSAAIAGCVIGGLTLNDNGPTWDCQLREAGFRVHATLTA